MFGKRGRELLSLNESGPAAEDRSDYRAETTGLNALISTPKGDIVAVVHNLSTRGLMASASNPPHVGDRVVVSIDALPAVHGQIRWVKDNRFGVLLFSALPVGAFRVADQGRGRRPRPPRYIVRIPVHIEAPGIDRSAMIQNVSHNGLSLETGLPVNPGKLLVITIEGHPPMEGRVRWSRGSRCGVMLSTPIERDIFELLIQKK